MKERPILFSGEMVRAILNGRKTQTRRAMKPQPVKNGAFWEWGGAGWSLDHGRVPVVPGHSMAARCPYGQPGDRLWVRETWFQKGRYVIPAWPEAEPDDAVWSGSKTIQFPASGDNPESREDGRVIWRKRPSIHMPRWACRILLEVTAVRVERLQDISQQDALAEGGPTKGHSGGPISSRAGFKHIWQEINGVDSWDANPWVWVVEFSPIDQQQEVGAE